MIFKNLRERLSNAYRNGRTQKALDIEYTSITEGFFVPQPFDNNEENTEFVNKMREIIEERRSIKRTYDLLERTVYILGYKRG